MLNLLVYLVIGMCAVSVTAIDEMVTAVNNGFALFDYLDWYDARTDIKHSKTWNVFAFIWGWTLWPIRVLIFHTEQHDRFEAYKAYLNEKEES